MFWIRSESLARDVHDMTSERNLTVRTFTDHNTKEVYKGFDHKFTRDCEWIALALVIGDVTVFYLDGPEAVTELHCYLEDIEDGASMIGVYHLQPGTTAPFYHDPNWKPATS